MAVDRIKLFIPSIPESILRQTQLWDKSDYKGPWKSHSTGDLTIRHPRRVSRYKFGALSTKSGIFDVDFLKYSEDNGDLFLSFSVSSLYFYKNYLPKSCVISEDFAELTLKCVAEVLDETLLPHFSHWHVSYIEINVDILDAQSKNDGRLLYISKQKAPYKKASIEFADRGTVYQNGKGGNRSKAKYISYDKIKEQADRYGIDLRDELGLTQSEGLLRIESKLSGDPLKRLMKKVRNAIDDGNSLCDLDVVFHELFQISVMTKAISDLNLDKIITTRKNLMKIIKSTKTLSDYTKKQAIRILNHINGEKYIHKIHKQTLKKYLNVILSLGYSPYTSENEIKPVTLKRLQKALAYDLEYVNFL